MIDNEITLMKDQIQAISNNLEMLKEEFDKYKSNSEVIEKIDLIVKNKIQENLKEHTIKVKLEISKQIETAKEKLREESEQIFSDSKFIHSLEENLIEIIENEVKVEVKSEIQWDKINDLIKDIIQDNIKNNLKDITSMIVNTLVVSLNKKLSNEYRVAKELCYSIDSEIKHTLLKTPISYTSEKEIKEKIIGILKQVPTIKSITRRKRK